MNPVHTNQRPQIILKQEKWKEGVYFLSFKLIYIDDMHSSQFLRCGGKCQVWILQKLKALCLRVGILSHEHICENVYSANFLINNKNVTSKTNKIVSIYWLVIDGVSKVLYTHIYSLSRTNLFLNTYKQVNTGNYTNFIHVFIYRQYKSHRINTG